MIPQPVSPLAETIAAQLSETEDLPIQQIERAVQVCGPEVVQTVLSETLAIEAEGGQMLPDGSRRRTPGGVFFNLLRHQVTKEEWHRIYPTHPAARAEQFPPMVWEDRIEAVRELMAQKGKASVARMVVTGRPADVKRREGFFIVTVISSDPLPLLPKDLPVVTPAPTTYKLCIANKQWRRIEAALRDPHDQLVADGYAYPNDKASAVVVFVQNIATKFHRAPVQATEKAKFPYED